MRCRTGDPVHLVDTDSKMPGTQSHSLSLQENFHGILQNKKKGKRKKKEKKKKKPPKTQRHSRETKALVTVIVYLITLKKKKRGQKKILLENCPMIVYLFKMIRCDHQEVEI